MKLRIIKKNEFYYPQVKILWWWQNLTYLNRFYLKDAEQDIKNFLKEDKINHNTQIEIIKEYNIKESAQNTGIK